MDTSSTTSPAQQKKKGFSAYLPIIIIVALVVVAAILWYKSYSKFIRSDDAVVAGYNSQIAAQIGGRIVSMHVHEGDTVLPNQLLVELDSRALLDKQHEVNAQIAEANASLSQAYANYKYNQEQQVVKELAFELAQKDYRRAQALYKGQAISLEQLQESQINFETAQSQVESAKEIVNVSKAQIEHQKAAINSAKVQLNSIGTQLTYTKIYSPSKGVVAKRWLQQGDVVEASQTIYTVAIDTTRWIAVNLEETKLRFIRTNQKVQIAIDAYPNVAFTGRITFIGPMAASQFSLIPASNAAGNFTKVVQRIPIKVSIDAVEGGSKLASYPLRIGMSAEIKTHKE